MQSIRKNNKHPTRKIMIIVVILIVVSGLYFTIAFATKIWPFTTSTSPTTTTEQPTSTDQSTDTTTESTDTTQNTTNTVKNDSTPNTPQTKGSVTITAASQNDEGDLLQVRTLIPGVHNTGTCTLTLTKGATVRTVTSGIQPGPSTSTCQGFDVSIADQNLTSGEWLVTTDVSSDSVQASASTKVTIQ